jgi:hypothetical protein
MNLIYFFEYIYFFKQTQNGSKMKTNFTFQMRCWRLLSISFIIFLASLTDIYSQGSACHGQVNVSVDPLDTCRAVIRPSTVKQGNPIGHKITVVTAAGNTIALNVDSFKVGSSYIGALLKVTVNGPNVPPCWGNVLIEDKTAPIIDCRDTIYNRRCYQAVGITPVTLGIGVNECSSFSWTSAPPVITPCNDVTVDGVAKTATRSVSQTWTATDKFGMSSSCVIRYNVHPIVKSEIFGPANDTVQCNGNYPKIAGTQTPSPAESGYPVAIIGTDTIQIRPGDQNIMNLCNLTSSFSDRVIKPTKIMRTWTVNGWTCGAEFTCEFIQILIIEDKVLPSITVTPALRRVTTGESCNASVRLRDYFTVNATDNCTTPVVTVSNITLGAINPNIYTTFPIGSTNIVYTATDDAGNTRTATVTLIVEDKTPPVAVCVENTVVSLTNDGTARMRASSFNLGSKDECELDVPRMEVMRMDSFSNCSPTVRQLFGPEVEFCCADIGKTTIVLFRVWDKAGNSNTCMVNVKVQNKIRPIITCIADVTIQCNSTVALDSASLRTRFGAPTILDACGTPNVRHSVVDGRDQCGKGIISRTWIVTDGQGVVGSCTQIIRSQPGASSRPFFVNRENDLDPNDDIVWPKKEVILSGCVSPNSPQLRPDSTGRPEILYNRFACGVIAINSKDEVYTLNTPLAGSNNSCLKILRTWSVIDWCTPSSVTNPYTFQQIIKVENKVAPVVTSVAQDTCLQLTGCTGTGRTRLGATATDDCTGNMSWTYSIDAGNNGGPMNGYDIVRSGTGNSISLDTLDLPLGRHRIVFTFRDLCGNMTSKENIFNISNCKAPTPYLMKGLVIGLSKMNGGGMVTTLARDFNAGSFHSCPNYRVYLAFSRNISDTARVFTCANLGINSVRVFAGIITPANDTIWDSAIAEIDIQDNNTPKACTSALANRTVRGQLITEINANLKGAEVLLEGSQTLKLMSDNSGNFIFDQALLGGSYILKPTKDDDHLNGVNTLDLLHIQKHVLGVKRFTSPYKYIAADIDRDGKVNVSDLVELRKLVLGVTDKFSKNTSWRFIDRNFTFKDLLNPLNELIPEAYAIDNLRENMNVDFLSIKIGDVDQTAAANATGALTEARNAKELSLVYDNKAFAKGETFSVSLTLNEARSLAGMQFGINFDNTTATLLSADSKVTGTNEYNLGLNKAEKGIITASWNNQNLTNVDEVVTLTFKAVKAGNVADLIKMNTGVITDEAYDADLNTLNLKLRNKKPALGFELYQNIPNPFSNTTAISFDLPTKMDARLSVYDVTGKVIKQVSKTFDAGSNTIEISKASIGTSGIYYYKLDAGTYTLTKKMVIID